MSTSHAGSVISIEPLHAQEHVEPAVRAFWPATVTPAAPGDQGAVTTGTQGMGVSVPEAAEVAAATWGFAVVLHMPNGEMFCMGTKSFTVAVGIPAPSTICTGRIASEPGASPSLHRSLAPSPTSFGIRGAYTSHRRCHPLRRGWPRSH